MTDEPDTPTVTADETDIEDRIERVESVIDRLKRGDLSLARATEQYEGAKAEIESLREDLAVGDGTVAEHDEESVTEHGDGE